MGQYTIRVSKIGDVKIDAEGFVGESCENATRAVELAMQGVTTNKDHKPEYHESEQGERQKQAARF